MKRLGKTLLALLLAFLMFCEAGHFVIAYAAEEIDKAVNPASYMEFPIPERFRDGGNWFFIPEPGYLTSEKSTEKLYIPIHRSGDLEGEAEIVLKVIDLTAKHDVNYSLEIYKEKHTPDVALADLSILDVILNADGQEEIEFASENELGEMIHDLGGAELVDGEGNTVAGITAARLDEKGDPIREAPEVGETGSAPAEFEADEDAEEGDWSEVPGSPTDALRRARDVFTGTTSDRQEIISDESFFPAGGMSEEEFDQAMADAMVDDYPGREYRLNYAPGEDLKLLVVTPRYSEEADGDAQVLLMLKDPSEGFAIGEDVNPVSLTILDEDEPEPVYVSMAETEVTAQGGKAVITVTREGRLKAPKGVMVSSWDGSAQAGKEYSGIGAQLYFPMGITSRTIELPVYHGAEDKDFYVTITALDNERVLTATTHVIIPAAAEVGQAEGSLLDAEQGKTRTGRGVTKNPINLKAGRFEGGGDNYFSEDTGFHISTRDNREETTRFWIPVEELGGYAYDGLYVEYDGFVNWCDAYFILSYWKSSSSGDGVHYNYFDDGGKKDDHWLYSSWNSPKAPWGVTIEARNDDNEGPAGTNSRAEMWVQGVYLMKRQFTVTVESPEVKPLLGLSNEDVLTNYQRYMLDNATYSSRSLWTEDSFAINAVNPSSPLRLAGVEAQRADGSWYRISTIEGLSTTATVTLTADLINQMAAQDCISWEKNGKINRDSYQGYITVRPVFDYQNIEVEVLADENGDLIADAPNPVILWDFNSDEDMNSHMGANKKVRISYYGQKDGEGNNYYVFESPNGNDPYVSVETGAEKVEDIQWVKIRYKNVDSTGKYMEIFGVLSNGKYGDTCTRIPLAAADGQWHEAVFNLVDMNKETQGKSVSAWTGARINLLRFDPMQECSSTQKQSVIVDYVAFFPTRETAQAFRDPEGSGDAVLKPGKYIYHQGDRLVFSSQLSRQGVLNRMLPDGIQYDLRKYGETGELRNWADAHYIGGSIDLQLTATTLGGKAVDRPYYCIKPSFTPENNTITVVVSDEDFAKFDTTRGIFALDGHVSMTHRNGEYTILIAEDVLTNDIYELRAYPRSEDDFACWKIYSGKLFAQDVMYIRTDPRPERNVLTLSVEPDGIWTTVTGVVASSTFNVTSGRSGMDNLPAKGAYVQYGDVAAWSDDEGRFTLPAAYSCRDRYIRFLVTYNGTTSIHEAKVPAKSAATSPAPTMGGAMVQAAASDAGLLLVENFSATGARVLGVTASQSGQIQGALNALILNGQELTFKVQISNANQYVLDNEIQTENIKEVKLFFMSQYTGERHGEYSSLTEPAPGAAARWSWDEEKGEFTLVIFQFDPEHPEEWTYGDVLMVEIVTDKKSTISAWSTADSQRWESFYDEEKKEIVMRPVDLTERDRVGVTRYEPVSTGFGVYADPNYAPTTFKMDMDDLAGMLGVTPQTDEEGNLLEETRASFGTFPYIGEITAGIHIFSSVYTSSFVSEEAEDLMADLDDLAGVSGSAMTPQSGNYEGRKKSNVKVSVFFKQDYTFYGGVRFMLGMIVTYGGGAGYQRQKNPYRSYQDMAAKLMYARSIVDAGTGDLIYDPRTTGTTRTSEFGGAHFQISVYFGFYLDFGYMNVTTVKDDGTSTTKHDMIFMGAGGFVGFRGNAGYTWYQAIAFVPVYLNVEAGFDLTVFFGASDNPELTKSRLEGKSEMDASDFRFEFDFKGKVYASFTVGAGLYKIVGVRCSVTASFELAYGRNITGWYPDLFDSGWGYVSEITFTGTLDLFVTSIDLYSATWPLPLAGGFLYYFQEARRAELCVSCVNAGLNTGRGSDDDRAKARQMADELAALLDQVSKKDKDPDDLSPLPDAETIENKTYALRSFAYDAGIITWTTYNRIHMNKQGGIVGSIMDGAMQDEGGMMVSFHTNPHVDSQWVAQDGELNAAFSVVKSSELVKDAYAQPSAQLMDIGNDQFLMVFLDDSPQRSSIMASTLMWTVYDASNDSWTEPQVVQADRTADSKPHLADAGDKVILSWASIADGKYDELRYDVARERGVYELDPDTELHYISSDMVVDQALEADPARVLSVTDIFTVEFNKASRSFGPITQLTDDYYYDDYPQAVYDKASGDYLVIYTKTAQDASRYASPGDKLKAMVEYSPDPAKTYSVICYMLYNGTQEADDPHAVGWVTDYYYPNETAASPKAQEETLAQWGGQRFLNSSVKTETGENADPPITDLTTCGGFNGMAAYAFTVDRDFDLDTAEDRELYFRYYNFTTHQTYVSVRAAGEVTEEVDKYDSSLGDFVTTEVTRPVEVGTPKIIRCATPTVLGDGTTTNGGSTFLFWREDGESLKYLNISEMMNAKVARSLDADPANPADWTWAVGSDGAFAFDPLTGKAYEPRVQKVDFGSLMTEDAIHITDYQVISDKDDNLYVVWTDSVTSAYTDPETGEVYPRLAQEIFASALIAQPDRTFTYVDEAGVEQTETTRTFRWSKPYRLTRENGFNDGVTLALDKRGGLIIVHNQYFKKMAQSEAEAMQLVREGKIGITQDKEGNYYAASLEYNSPVSLMVTRCDQVGSLEATDFLFSDAHPVPGQTISVSALIENVGLTDAEGCVVEFYEARDGVRGRKIWETVDHNEIVAVNTAKKCTFPWTVPADGIEGYTIQAVIAEKRLDGSYYDAVVSSSEPFTVEPSLVLNVEDVYQDGDQFRVNYSVENIGNAPAEEGTRVGIRLVGLYGDLDSERYGHIKKQEVYSRDITADLPARKMSGIADAVDAVLFEDSALVDIPVSLLQLCGYDAIQLVIVDDRGVVQQESDQYFVHLDSPMNLELNDGRTLSLDAGETADLALSYDTTVFINQGTVVYSVEDPEIATVDASGRVTGLNSGATRVTATILPFGKSASVDVTVSGPLDYEEPSPGPAFVLTSRYYYLTAGETGTIQYSAFREGTLTFASSDPSIVTVDENGTITAVGAGLTTITVTFTEAATGNIYQAAGIVSVTAAEEPEPEYLEDGPASSPAAASEAEKDSVTLTAEEVEALESSAVTVELEGEAVTLDAEELKEASEGKDVTVTVTRNPDGTNRIDVTADGEALDIILKAELPAAGDGQVLVMILPDGTEKVVKKSLVEDGTAYALIPAGVTVRIEDRDVSFPDVAEGAWYADAVDFVSSHELFQGTDKGFEPNIPMTRAMLATVLYRLEEGEAVGANPFADVAEGKWYTDAITWASSAGIVNGTGNGFEPDVPVTREQIATMLYRYANYLGLDTGDRGSLEGFTDGGDTSSWAADAMAWAVSVGLFRGDDTGALNPKDNATRAEVATLFQRLVGILVK